MQIIQNRKKFFILSLLVIIIGFGFMIANAQAGKGALNWDVEFTGGTSMELNMNGKYDNDKLISIIKDVTDQSSPQIQEVLGTNNVEIKLQSIDSPTRTALVEAIQKEYSKATLTEANDISGTVSGEMQRAAIKATLIAAVAMLIYISIRFKDVRAGGSACLLYTSMDYDMNLDMDTMKYDMSFDVNYEGKKYDLGTVYYSLADGIVVTTDTLLGAYQLAGAVEEKNDSYLFTEAFARDFKAALGQQKYITLISAEDMTGVDMEGVSMSGLQDAVFTFYEDVFKGFETGMVKKISGGYAIQADGQQVAQLMINMLDFIGKNPEQVLNATEAYMMTVMDSMNASCLLYTS